ncbi:MarR family protein [Saccharicrinis carchari]|uniref:MarR family protein n=1 Tax=Saccharicrinis carchari TaxID=1168039 RepID=A0A521B224_SACCC|nr:MarR family transcriptional regulator [Saccharicrinis carchari]SMO41154.1 MarR family protein [Saccharicrinis carchari]
MDNEDRIKKQKELVEELGRYFDKEGMQPIAGRIHALLMVMDKEKFTFEEIVEELRISKSSASVALRNLEIRGNIEYVTLPGDRKRYFQIKKHNTSTLIDEFVKKTKLFKELVENVVELKEDKQSMNAQFMMDMIKMIDCFIDRMEIKK